MAFTMSGEAIYKGSKKLATLLTKAIGVNVEISDLKPECIQISVPNDAEKLFVSSSSQRVR